MASSAQDIIDTAIINLEFARADLLLSDGADQSSERAVTHICEALEALDKLVPSYDREFFSGEHEISRKE